ncbi:hypothetical protein K457DRAFT_555124 [Linnemannia elongata AG-77]|uniref:Uncharacterized protein n=1 Tax=Linnemannia elongata AG-77 TaxID=1314771 RepID=A0A197JTA5_9FUNG|nr:hypothetical protein K457DRAFT_555124 [Linnemannia elongata AG-77]
MYACDCASFSFLVSLFLHGSSRWLWTGAPRSSAYLKSQPCLSVMRGFFPSLHLSFLPFFPSFILYLPSFPNTCLIPHALHRHHSSTINSPFFSIPTPLIFQAIQFPLRKKNNYAQIHARTPIQCNLPPCHQRRFLSVTIKPYPRINNKQEQRQRRQQKERQ